MPDDLLATVDELKRDRLRRAGWKEAGASTATHGTSGVRYWRNPSGAILTEPEAFAFVEKGDEPCQDQ